MEEVQQNKANEGKALVHNVKPIAEFRDAWLEELRLRNVILPEPEDGGIVTKQEIVNALKKAENFESGMFYFEPMSNTMRSLLKEKGIACHTPVLRHGLL